MALPIIYRGQTVSGKIELRTKDFCISDLENPFPIPTGSLVEIIFPGATAPVILSTANSGEVTVSDALLSTITFEMTPTKSLLLKVIDNGVVNLRVTSLTNKVTIFEKIKAFKIVDIANV